MRKFSPSETIKVDYNLLNKNFQNEITDMTCIGFYKWNEIKYNKWLQSKNLLQTPQGFMDGDVRYDYFNIYLINTIEAQYIFTTLKPVELWDNDRLLNLIKIDS